MNPALDIRRLFQSYGRTPILADVSFQVARGECFIIIGPNGAGKTTLLKLLAGIGKLLQGEILIGGRAIQTLRRRALARKIALVPQLPPSDFPFTVGEIVLMGRSPHLGILGLDSDRDRRVAERSMAFTAVDHLADRRLMQLSGGERQRVFLARAVCQEPDIILLDEPTTALDLAHQVRIMDLMAQLKQDRGMSIVMVSHDINLAAMYADRMLLLKNGRIVAIGPPAKIIDAATITAAYDCRVVVDESPWENIPRATPVPGKYLDPAK